MLEYTPWTVRDSTFSFIPVMTVLGSENGAIPDATKELGYKSTVTCVAVEGPPEFRSEPEDTGGSELMYGDFLSPFTFHYDLITLATALKTLSINAEVFCEKFSPRSSLTSFTAKPDLYAWFYIRFSSVSVIDIQNEDCRDFQSFTRTFTYSHLS